MTATLPTLPLPPQATGAPPVGAPQGVAPAIAATGGPQAAGPLFSALLPGLAQAGEPRAAAGPGPVQQPLAVGLPVPAALADSAPLPPAPASAVADPTPAAGDSLPADGSSLPPGDVTALLAAIDIATSRPATPPAPVPMPVPAAEGTPPASPPATAPATTLPAATPAGGEALTDVARPTSHPVLPAAWLAVADTSDQATMPATTGAVDPAAPPPLHPARAEPGMTLPLSDDFRARLDAALALASRPSGLPEASGAINLFGATAMAGPAAAVPAPPSGVGSPADASLTALPPTLEPLAGREAWSQALGDRLLLMAERGQQTATLRLQPEHLGPLEVKIEVDGDGTAQVLFSTHHAQTRDALEAAMPRLRELFADQGLSLSQAQVDAGGSAFTQRGFAAGLPAWQRPAPADETDAVPVARTWQLARPSDRHVDILV